MEGFDQGIDADRPREIKMAFPAEHLPVSFSRPNFYFHATGTYAILRKIGAEVGKMDYLARLRAARDFGRRGLPPMAASLPKSSSAPSCTRIYRLSRCAEQLERPLSTCHGGIDEVGRRV
jgi:hypothetical protein